MKNKILEILFNIGDFIVGTSIITVIIFGCICEFAPLSLIFINF